MPPLTVYRCDRCGKFFRPQPGFEGKSLCDECGYLVWTGAVAWPVPA